MASKTVVKNIGGLYTPPRIEGSPKIEDGVATIRLTAVLNEKERRSVQAAFDNFCQRQKVHLTLTITNYIITIKRAAESILMAVLEFLEIKQPAEKTPATPRIKPPTVMRAPPRKLHVPHGGIRRLATTT